MQYWHAEVPDAVQALLDGMRGTNADCTYRRFDDAAARQYLVEYFDGDVTACFDACALPAMRADLFRYCFLLRDGGLYVDADFAAEAPFTPLLERSGQGALYRRDKGLTNSFMYFREPGHPLLSRVLDDVLDNLRARRSNNVFNVTGPAVLRSLLASRSTRDLFNGLYFVDDTEFARHARTVTGLAYKRRDGHWTVAREKGRSIYTDRTG